jgi:hypothetical protein
MTVAGLVIFAPLLLTIFTAPATMYLTWPGRFPRGEPLSGLADDRVARDRRHRSGDDLVGARLAAHR